MRSCYSTKMRFYHDAATETDVEWYFLDDVPAKGNVGPADSELIPFAHSFGSRIYERDDGQPPPIGERYSPVPWRNGSPPAVQPIGGLGGTADEWLNGCSIDDPLPAFHPGTNCPVACRLAPPPPEPKIIGGWILGASGFGACHMITTFDLYQPFGAAAPTSTNLDCQFVEDLYAGRGTNPLNTVAWTHYIDCDVSIPIVDGCTRTAAVNTLNYIDGDEVRIPTGGTGRYVVVWVTLCDREGTLVKRCYLMRHSA